MQVGIGGSRLLNWVYRVTEHYNYAIESFNLKKLKLEANLLAFFGDIAGSK